MGMGYFPPSSSGVADGSITSAKIADGAIVNADVNASAAVVGSKLDLTSGTGGITSGATGKTAVSLSDTTTTTGITIGGDTNLYRSAADTLRTDDVLTVGHNNGLSTTQVQFNNGGEAYIQNAAYERLDLLGQSATRGAIVKLLERPAPANAAADSGHWYLVDDGSGNTQSEMKDSGGLMFSLGRVKNGFYGVAPVARPTAYTQTYSTTTRTHAQAAVATTGATITTPYGYTTAAQADAIPLAINELKQVVNQVIDDLQANGLLQ